jgi:hypothetical protein
MCLPMGVERSTLKFWRSVRQDWLALIAVTSRSNLGEGHLLLLLGASGHDIINKHQVNT